MNHGSMTVLSIAWNAPTKVWSSGGAAQT